MLLTSILENITKVIGNPTTVDTWWVLGIITVLFAIYESWWRRWFGGHHLPSEFAWLDVRFLKHVINVIAIFAICYYVKGIDLLWAIYFPIIIQIWWALGHGPWFDCGRGGYPDEKMLKRYNKVWFAPILNWCFPEEHRYGHFYDFCGLLIRYSWPLLLAFFVPTFNFGLLVLGELVAITYAICNVASDKKVIQKHGANEIAEYIVGFLAGLFICLN